MCVYMRLFTCPAIATHFVLRWDVGVGEANSSGGLQKNYVCNCTNHNNNNNIINIFHGASIPNSNEWSLAMSCSDDAFLRILIQDYLWTPPSAPGFNEDVVDKHFKLRKASISRVLIKRLKKMLIIINLGSTPPCWGRGQCHWEECGMAQPPRQTHTPVMSIQDLCHTIKKIIFTMKSTLVLEFMQVKLLHKSSRAEAEDERLTSFIPKTSKFWNSHNLSLPRYHLPFKLVQAQSNHIT